MTEQVLRVITGQWVGVEAHDFLTLAESVERVNVAGVAINDDT